MAPQTGMAAGGARTPPVAAPSAGERLLGWIGRHRQASSYAGGAIVLGALLFVWNITATRRSEAEARATLGSARVAYESRNLGLAQSELARVRENFAGTKAAEEATLLLAQVRLLQGQADQGLQLLQDFAPGASREYRAQAYGLLAAALENAGKPVDAAQAYERAAEAAPLAFMQAQNLSDAARAWVVAGDTARGVTTYRRIVKEYESSAVGPEAAIRLGELTKGAPLP